MKNVFIVFLVMFSCISNAQENTLGQKSLAFDIGSWRNRYWYPISELQFRNDEMFKSNWGAEARYRSYGSWFLNGVKSIDVTLIGKNKIRFPQPGTHLWIGAGVDIRLRNFNDERSAEVNSAEPLFMMEWKKIINPKFHLRIPLWSRWYSNGMSLSLLPTAEFYLNERWGVFTRFEGSLLNIYHQKDSEWRKDLFFGLRMQL